MITIKKGKGRWETVCECGEHLPFKATIIMRPEERRCPRCGKVYYIENPVIDWELICKQQSAKSVD